MPKFKMTTLTKYFILTIIVFGQFVCYSQNEKITAETQTIVKGLQKGNTYETAFVPERTKSKQLDLYNKLKATATDNELKLLTEHKNGVVRVYAFVALTERNPQEIFEIILKHIDDKEVINCYSHGFEFVHSVIYKRAVAEFFVSSQVLTTKERQKLDGILIFSKYHLNYTDYLLRDIEPQEKYYNQIKIHAQASEYKYAVIALARFKRKEDISIIENKIKALPYYSIESIEIFPDQYFKNVLNHFNETESKPYGIYSAVAVFQDSFAYKYLYKSIQEPAKNDYYSEQKAKEIYKAIEKYKCNLYNELFFQLWQTDFIINDSIFKYLKTIDQKRSVQIAIQSLKNPDKLDNRTLVIEDLLNFLIEFDSSSAKSIIHFNIDSADVHTLSDFVDKAKYFKDTAIINSLFVRLEQTDNGHIYIPIVKTVLAYNDKVLNNRLLDSIRANKGIKDWGLKDVIKILDEYKLKL